MIQQKALMAETLDVEPLEDIDVPHNLVSDEELDRLMSELKPSFVPLSFPGSSSTEALPAKDPVTGVTQRRLSNGISINYRSVVSTQTLLIARQALP